MDCMRPIRVIIAGILGFYYDKFLVSSNGKKSSCCFDTADSTVESRTRQFIIKK